VVQTLDHHAPAVVQRGAHAQRHINTLFHQIHRAVAHQHLDAYLGVAGQKGRHQFGHHRLGERDGTTDADGAARLGLHLGHCVGSCLGRLAHGLTVAQVGFTHFCQRKLARGALQQTHAQLGLKL